MLTEKASGFKIVSALRPQTVTASGAGSVVDLLGFNSCLIVLNIGTTGATLDGSNFLGVRLQDSDDGSTGWADVTDSSLLGGFSLASGSSIFIIDSSSEDERSYKFAYTGIKQFLRLSLIEVGTISLPMSAVMLLGDGVKPQA